MLVLHCILEVYDGVAPPFIEAFEMINDSFTLTADLTRSEKGHCLFRPIF
jgi:hypothetical protein